jgi:hypothetical protein
MTRTRIAALVAALTLVPLIAGRDALPASASPEQLGCPPPEVQSVRAAANKVTYSWASVSSATSYEALRGAVNALPVGPGDGDEACLGDLPGLTLDDATVPSRGAGFWYLVRAKNDCGPGSYGNQSNGVPRVTSTACP